MIQMFQHVSWISVRMTPWLLGLMASYILLVKHARWHMQALQWALKSQWTQHHGELSHHLQISVESAKAL